MQVFGSFEDTEQSRDKRRESDSSEAQDENSDLLKLNEQRLAQAGRSGSSTMYVVLQKIQNGNVGMQKRDRAVQLLPRWYAWKILGKS